MIFVSVSSHLEKQDAEDIIENGTSKASATLNDDDHIIKGLTDDLAGGK